jgi:hypothetical protein
MRGWLEIGFGSGVAALLLAAGLFAAPQASAQSSSFGCFAPCDAAEIYLASIGYLEGNLSNSRGRCRTQCADLREGCFNAVSSAERCFRGSAMSVLSFGSQSCRDLEGSASGECQNGIASDTQSLNSFLGEDSACGRNTCEAAFQECMSICNETNPG